MPGPEMDLKRELFEAGNRLLKPPSSVDDLLALLDRVEHCLSFVEQQPPVEMQDALCPAFRALVTKELLNHPDNDVRVGVAACLTEISRITAPDVPYGDQLMKEVFRLTISAFEGLSDKSSKSFGKRVSILETVARVKSCAVLLDLDCDDLVVEMFRNFYKCIRDFHTANVFTSMESIMTLVLEEYDAISDDLLFTLLSVLKREKQDASPIAKRLGEKVVQNCASKLKSCIVEAIKSLKIGLLDYDFVVTLACQTSPNHNPFREVTPDVPLVNRDDSPVKTVEKELAVQASPCLSPHSPPFGKNVIVEEDDATQGMLNTSHELDSNVVACATETIQKHVQVGPGAVSVTHDMAMNPEPVSLSKSETKSEEVTRKRGPNPFNAKDLMKTDSSKFSQLDVTKLASESQAPETHHSKEVLNTHHHDSSMDPGVADKNRDSSNQVSPKAVEINVVNLESPSQTDIHPEKKSSEMITGSEEPVLVQKAASSHQNSEKRPSDVLNDLDILHLSLEKAVPDVVGDASNLVLPVEVKNEQDIEGDSQLGITDGTQRSKKRGRPRKDASMSAVKGVKGGISLEDTSQKRSRLTFTYPEEGKKYGEDLIGTRIKIWWPADREYYEGVVKAYDPITRRHRILYTDNEIESLRLHKQKWKLLKSSIGSGKETSHNNVADASDKQESKKLKTDSSSAGTMGNTDSPLKRGRGRPPKNCAALASYDSPVKSSVLEGQNKLNEKNDSVAHDGKLIKTMDSEPRCKDAPNINLENTEHDVLPENGGKHIKQNATVGTGVTPAVRFDINDPFSYRSDDESDPRDTVTPKTGNSNVSVTKDVKSGSAEEPRVADLNAAFGTGMSSRKKKRSTNSISNSPAITGSTDTSTKKRRGRPPYKFLLQNSLEDSKDPSKQLGDPKVDESRSVNRSHNVAVVKNIGSPDESRNATYMSAEHNVRKSIPDMAMRMGTKEEAAPAQTSSKLVTEQPKLGSPTGLKIRFKTSVPEPIIRRRRSRKTISSPSDHLNKDGSVKRRRGRPPFRTKGSDQKFTWKAEGNFISGADNIKPNSKILDKADISQGNISGPSSKNNTLTVNGPEYPVPADIGIKDKKDLSEVADNVSYVAKEACVEN